MKLFNINKNIFCNLISLILLSLIVYLLFVKPKEGFVKLIDYTNTDPSIQPKPPQDPCLGDLDWIKRGGDNSGQGLFITNTNSNYLVVPQEKTFLFHSNENACEANCALQNGCVGIKYDQDLYDKEVSEGREENYSPNCTRYTAAPAGAPNTISSTSICTHQPQTCTVTGYESNTKDNTLTSLWGISSHSNEGACAWECTMRQPECTGYWYHNKINTPNCKIFKDLNNNESTRIPKNMYCSKSKIDNINNWKQVPQNISDSNTVCLTAKTGHGSGRFNSLDDCIKYFNLNKPYSNHGYLNYWSIKDMDNSMKNWKSPPHNCYWVGDVDINNKIVDSKCQLMDFSNNNMSRFDKDYNYLPPPKSYYLPGTPIIDVQGKNITPK
tara:strand:- start:39 stop:1184 length:1146 start_codon:yes stop_codon:yes gene_type:complete